MADTIDFSQFRTKPKEKTIDFSQFRTKSKGPVSPTGADATIDFSQFRTKPKEDKKLTTSDLLDDQAWIKASKQIYKNQTGNAWTGTDTQAAKWGIGNTADFEYDITKTIGVAKRSKDFDADTAKAWNTVLDKYGQLGITWGGTGRALKYMATDPTFLPSFFTPFIAGKALSLAGGKAAKAGVKLSLSRAVKEAQKKATQKAAAEGLKGKQKKELIRSSVKQAQKDVATNVGILSGTEAGIYSGTFDYARQIAELNLDRRDDISIGQTLLATGIGAGAGGLLGWGIPTLTRVLNKSSTDRLITKAPAKIFTDKEEQTISRIQTTTKKIPSTTKEATKIAKEAVKINPNVRVLSYGAGKVNPKTNKIKEVTELEKSGAKVDAYDLEHNMIDLKNKKVKPQYNIDALENKYDIINVSNVLNVLGKNPINKARKIVEQVSDSLADDGVAIFNPSKRGKVNEVKLENILKEKFDDVEPIKGGFKASKPKEKIITEVGPGGTKKTLKEKTLLFFKKNFYSDAGAGETIAKGKILQKAIEKNTERKVKMHIAKLEKALKKDFGSLENVDEATMAKLVAGLEGRTFRMTGILEGKKSTLNAIKEMRRSIDDSQQELIDNGVVKKTSKLKTRIEKSKSDSGALELKAYVNTSYKVFDDPTYKVGKESREEGRQWFIDKFRESGKAGNKLYRDAKVRTEQGRATAADIRKIHEYEGDDGIIDGLINQITRKHGDDLASHFEGILAAAPRGKKGAIKILFKKKDLDPVIKGLLGETKDVRQRYANTLTKLNQIRANFEYNKALQKAAIEGSEIVKQSGIARGEHSLRVSNLISDPNIQGLTRPLKNLWTTQEFADIIEQGTEIKPRSGAIYNHFLLGKAATQIAKTAYSVASIARNFAGAAMQALGNGYINPIKLAEATTAFRALSSMPKLKARKEIEKMSLMGVLDTDVKVQDMLELAKDIDSNFFLQGLKKHLPLAGKMNRKVLDFYQSMDNYWKWFAFLNEKGRYRQVLIDKGIDPDGIVRKFKVGGEDVVITNLDDYASNMVRDNMHNYGQTSRAVKWARRAPLADFIAFKTEMIRTSKNILKNGIRDLQEGAAMMARGERHEGTNILKGTAQFKAGMIRMGGATGAVVGVGAVANASADAFGLNDTVEGSKITKKEAIEAFDPSYNKGSDYYYLSPVKDGKGKRINMSYTDPWALFKNPVNAVIRAFQTEDDPEIALNNATNQLLQNTVDTIAPSILTSALLDIVYNTDKFGRTITKEQGMTKDNINRVMRLWEAFEPGTLRSLRKIHEASTRGGFTKSGYERDTIQNILSLTGVTIEDYDINKSLPMALYEPNTKLEAADTEYKKLFRNWRGNEPEKFIEYYVESQDKKFREAQKVFNFVKAAKATGMSNTDLYKAVTQGGYFKSFASKQFIRALVKDGSFIPDKPEDKSLRKWQHLIKRKNKEAAKGMDPVREDLWKLYRQYSGRPLSTDRDDATIDFSQFRRK